MRFYQMDAEILAKQLNSDLDHGLSLQSAEQGSNGLQNLLKLLVSACRSVRLKITLTAIVPAICFFIAIVFSVLNRQWDILWLTIAVLFLTLALFFMEEVILSVLKKKQTDRISRGEQGIAVIRNGKKTSISPEELRVGDLLCLSEGTILCADARILRSSGLLAMEAGVFNTHIPAVKHGNAIEHENLPPEKQENMLWKGSYIHSGSGMCMVTAINADCYIEKTGGRSKKKHRSVFFRQQNNLGHWISFLCTVFSVVLLLMAAFLTGRFVEAFLVLGALTALFLSNPMSALTRWTYYRTAEKLHHNGVLIRHFEAFDQMQQEKEVYFDLSELLQGNIALSQVFPIEKSEEDCLTYFALCNEGSALADLVYHSLHPFGLNEESICRMLIGSRRSIDSKKNTCGIFMSGSRSVAAVSGYWKAVVPYLKAMDDEVVRHIDELERHGKLVYLIAGRDGEDSFDFPNGGLKAFGLLIFDVAMDQQIVDMTYQLHRAGAKAHLIHPYTENFGNCMAGLYDMDGALENAPINERAVSADALPIKREKANLIYHDFASYTKAIYQTKCMFCGLKRALCFSAVFGFFMVLTIFAMLLSGLSASAVVVPLLLMRFLLAVPDYFLVESARNCNQFKRSFVLGLFCGVSGFLAAIFKMDMALLIMQVSAMFLSIYLWGINRSYLKGSKSAMISLAVILLAALLPWFFMGGNWVAMVLIALFAPLSAFILDLFY